MRQIYRHQLMLAMALAAWFSTGGLAMAAGTTITLRR